MFNYEINVSDKNGDLVVVEFILDGGRVNKKE